MHYYLWLVLDENGEVRMTRGEPTTGRGEVACSLTVKAPLSLFRKPLLRAEVQVPPTAGLTQREALLAVVDVIASSELNVDVSIKED